MKKYGILLFFCSLLFGHLSMAQVYYPDDPQPSSAYGQINHSRGTFIIGNNLLTAAFRIEGKTIKEATFTDKVLHREISFDASYLFDMVLKDGTTLDAADFKIDSGESDLTIIPEKPSSFRGLDRLKGTGISFVLRNEEKHISIIWSISVHDSCNFVQQHFHFSEDGNPDSIALLRLIHIPKRYRPLTSGIVDGLPVLSGNMFFAIEHPMAYTQDVRGDLTDNIAASVAMHSDNGFDADIAWGVTPLHQMRRGFLYYLEKIRAVPYRPFLHYNSWYDLSWAGLHLHEKDCMDRIQTYVDSLVVKRKTPLKAFLWDDGWDTPRKLWAFNSDLPKGFTRMEALARPYHAHMGVWISPWGGYGESKEERIVASRSHIPPLGTNANGFSLADTNYFNFFKATAEEFIRHEGVVLFKFDGVGAGNGASGATAAYEKDIEGLLRIITELRKIKPDLYFSLTVGTWPSPYWLRFGDAVWRAGQDFGTTGAGNLREQWLNYLDEQVYKNVVLRSKLYPLNALMNHGIDVATNGYPKPLPNDYKSLSEDIWSFFGDGTALQELYLNPHLLTADEWDLLAKAIHWSNAHKDILADVHWVGGDPLKGIYGYAAWNPHGGTLMLRNPTNELKTFTFSLQKVLELPDQFNGEYALYDVVKDQSEGTAFSTKPITLTFPPQAVKVIDVSMLASPVEKH